MKSLINGYNKVADFVEMLCKGIGGLAVFAFTIVIIIQVFCRNVVKVSTIWANDVAVICFVWATFFGAAYAIRHRAHYMVELVPPQYKKTNKVLDIIGEIGGFILFYVMIRYGIVYTMIGLRRISSSLMIPQAYFFACIPVSAVFMVFFNLQLFVEDVAALVKLMKGGNEQ